MRTQHHTAVGASQAAALCCAVRMSRCHACCGSACPLSPQQNKTNDTSNLAACPLEQCAVQSAGWARTCAYTVACGDIYWGLAGAFAWSIWCLPCLGSWVGLLVVTASIAGHLHCFPTSFSWQHAFASAAAGALASRSRHGIVC